MVQSLWISTSLPSILKGVHQSQLLTKSDRVRPFRPPCHVRFRTSRRKIEDPYLIPGVWPSNLYVEPVSNTPASSVKSNIKHPLPMRELSDARFLHHTNRDTKSLFTEVVLRYRWPLWPTTSQTSNVTRLTRGWFKYVTFEFGVTLSQPPLRKTLPKSTTRRRERIPNCDDIHPESPHSTERDREVHGRWSTMSKLEPVGSEIFTLFT